ncbi:MAG TPA: Flp family type IVb pilin [Caulobacteraceae bacterium]
MPNLSAYLRDESGASAAEYALILSLICIFLIGGIFALQGAITSAINTTDNAFHSRGF